MLQFQETEVDQERDDCRLQRIYKRNTAHVGCKVKRDTIIITETRIISKSFKKYLSSIPRKYEIEKQQTIAILGTAQYFGK